MKASADNTLPAGARQVMYSARGCLQNQTGKPLSDTYFTQGLLPDYMNEHSEITKDWDVLFDARSNFIEPHTNTKIPLGTLSIRAICKDSRMV